MFNFNKSNVIYAALLDVGSGSIGSAIIKVDRRAAKCEIIYARRDAVPRPSAEAGSEDCLLAVKEALLRVGRKLGKEGVITLTKHNRHARLNLLQVSIASPFSKTVAKNIQHRTKGKFNLDKSLLKNLSDNIAQRVWRGLMVVEGLSRHPDWVLVDSSIIAVSAGGYAVNLDELNPIKTNTIELTHLSSLIQSDLMNTIKTVRAEAFPASRLSCHSFMFIYYNIMNLNVPGSQNACICDITDEATEIGVIERGVLRHVSFVPYGIHTAGRSLQRLIKTPFAEALTCLKDNGAGRLGIDHNLITVTREYQALLEHELKSIRGITVVPRVLFTHTAWRAGSLPDQAAGSAFSGVILGDSVTRTVTERIIAGDATAITGKSADTALSLAAGFFHKTEQ